MSYTFEEATFQIDFNLAPAPIAAEAFIPYILVEDPELPTNDYVTIFSPDDAEDAYSDYTKQLIQDAFRQRQSTAFRLVGVDALGGEADPGDNYIEALDEVRQDNFVTLISADTSEEAELDALALACEALGIVLVAQTEASGVKEGAQTVFDTNEEFIVPIEVVEGGPAEKPYAPLALIRNMAIDVDEESRSFQTRLVGVEETGVDEGEYNILTGENWNVLINNRAGHTWLKEGKTISGRLVDEIVAVQVFKVRYIEAVMRLFDEYDAANEKLPVDTTGQEILGGEGSAVYSRLADAGHFVTGGFSDTDENDDLPPITDQDVENGKIPIAFTITTQSGAVNVRGNVDAERQTFEEN